MKVVIQEDSYHTQPATRIDDLANVITRRLQFRTLDPDVSNEDENRYTQEQIMEFMGRFIDHCMTNRKFPTLAELEKMLPYGRGYDKIVGEDDPDAIEVVRRHAEENKHERNQRTTRRPIQKPRRWPAG